MADFQTFIADTYQYVLGILAGVVTTILTSKWANREVLLTKRLFVQRIAYASDTETWGKIEVRYNGGPSTNLHLITVELYNESNKNIEDVEVVFTLPEDNVIYANSGEYKQDEVFTPVYFTKDFWDYFATVIEKNKNVDELDEEQRKWHQKDVNIVTRQRKYLMPVFNRHGVGVFSFLVDNVSFVEPSLMVSVRKKDVRLATYQEEEDRKKTQTKWVTLINLFFLFLVSYLIYSYSTSVVMAVSLMLVNIFGAYLLALGIYKSFVWTKNTLN